MQQIASLLLFVVRFGCERATNHYQRVERFQSIYIIMTSPNNQNLFSSLMVPSTEKKGNDKFSPIQVAGHHHPPFGPAYPTNNTMVGSVTPAPSSYNNNWGANGGPYYQNWAYGYPSDRPIYPYEYGHNIPRYHPPPPPLQPTYSGQQKMMTMAATTTPSLKNRSNSMNNNKKTPKKTTKNTKSASTATAKGSSSAGETQRYISPYIIELANQLHLPSDGRKFSNQHWKGALLLLYRWKTTCDANEQKFSTNLSKKDLKSYDTTKSVKAFCDKVLQRPSKRRQFNIHWKDSGLLKLTDENYDNGGDGAYERLRYDDPQLEAILDDYFSGRKRRAGYLNAKDVALEARQRQINDTWNQLTQGVPGMDLTKLHVLQDLIEAPYQKTVQIRSDDGVTSTHNVTIDGFDGRVITTATRGSSNGGSIKSSSKETTNNTPRSVPSSTQGLSNVTVNCEFNLSNGTKFT